MPGNDDTTDDRALLQRFARTRDAQAFGELASRHERSLMGIAKGLLGGSHSLAGEAVQSAWLKVIRYAGSFEGSCAVKTWLYRIVMNQCRDLAARERRLAMRAARANVGVNHDAVVKDDGFETRDELNVAVGLLPERQREVVLLCYHAELTNAQAAEILMIPLGTLKSRLNAALSSLRGAPMTKETIP